MAYAYFTEGWCWALAVVLADRYGWPVWGLGELEDWEDVVAAPAPGMFVDISGMHRERLDGWGEPFLMRSAHLLTIATDSLTEPAEALRAAASMAGPVFDLVVAEMLAV